MDQLVWRTQQDGLLAETKQGYEGTSAVEKRRIPVDAVLSGMIGQPMMLTLSLQSLHFENESQHQQSCSSRCGIYRAPQESVFDCEIVLESVF
jgi:hypothetical protein